MVDIRIKCHIKSGINSIWHGKHIKAPLYDYNQNMVESAPLTLTFLLAGGTCYPRVALAVGIINVISKPLYVYSYITKGPDARGRYARIGTSSCYFLGFATLFTSIYNLLKFNFF